MTENKRDVREQPEIATYEQAKERIKGLNALEFEALSMAAIDQDKRLRPSRFKKLHALGLVERYTENVYGNGKSPIDRVPLIVLRFRVPIPIHIAWSESGRG